MHLDFVPGSVVGSGVVSEPQDVQLLVVLVQLLFLLQILLFVVHVQLLIVLVQLVQLLSRASVLKAVNCLFNMKISVIPF